MIRTTNQKTRTAPKELALWEPESDRTDDAGEPSLEKALHSALHRIQGAAERWKPLILKGATDAELMSTIGYEFGLGGGSTQHGGCRYKGGKSPEFSWPGYADQSKAQTIKGKRLLAKVREILGIGAPGQFVHDDVHAAVEEVVDAIRRSKQAGEPERACRVCGCTEMDCRQCVEKTGAPCHWVGPDLCSACAPALNGHSQLQMIPIDQIAPSPTNPRKYFDPDKLQELADSIQEHGLAQPILVRPMPAPEWLIEPLPMNIGDKVASVSVWYVSCRNSLGKLNRIHTCYSQKDAESKLAERQREAAENQRFKLVAGERRWRAAKLAGLKVIEAKVRDLDDKAVLEIQFIENLQRADLSPIEEAEGYKRLLDEHGYTAESLAGKLAKSKSYVYGRLKLCNLPPAALDALAKGDLPATVGELIGRLPSMEMRERFWEDNFIELGKDWFEAPSFRDVRVEIERNYMRELKSAPFSQADAKLLPAAGSCKKCPKRTGNNKAEYPDARADMCPDVPCYDRKVAAFNRRKLAEAVKGDGIRVLTDEESREWFNWQYLANDKDRDWIDLTEECEAAMPEDDDDPIPTFGQLLDGVVKVEVVGQDRQGNVHQLVSREAAEKILKDKGIKLASPARTEADRKASQQKFKEEKQIRDQAANEICDRVIQSLTDKPLTVGGRSDWDDFLRAIALHLVSDADIARYVAKRHALGNGDHRAALHKVIEDRSGHGTLELIVEYMLAEELEWWIRSGELPYPLKRFPICEYFGHDPRKIEKRIAKERAAAKKAKPKAKAKAASGR